MSILFIIVVVIIAILYAGGSGTNRCKHCHNKAVVVCKDYNNRTIYLCSDCLRAFRFREKEYFKSIKEV